MRRDTQVGLQRLSDDILIKIFSYIPLCNRNIRKTNTYLWKTVVRLHACQLMLHFGLASEALDLIDSEGRVISGSQALFMALSIDPYPDGDLDLFVNGGEHPSAIIDTLAD